MPQQESAVEKLARLRAQQQGQSPQQEGPSLGTGGGFLSPISRLFVETLKALNPHPLQIAEEIGFEGGVVPFGKKVIAADAAARQELGERGQEQIATGMERGPAPIPGGVDTALSVAERLPVVGGAFSVGREAITRRDETQGAGNILASSIPLLGPAAAGAGETIPQDPVLGLAQGLAQVLPVAAGPAVRAIRTSRARPFAGVPFAEEVPATISQSEGAFARSLVPITARLESFFERSSFGAGAASRRLRVVKQKISKGAKEMFDDIAGPRIGDAVLSGEKVVERAKAFIKTATKEASDALDVQLRQNFANVPASLKSLKVRARQLLNELEPQTAKKGGMLRESLVSGDMDTLRAITRMDDFQPIPVVQRELSNLLRIARKGKGEIGSPDIGIVKQLSQRAHRAMIAGARKHSGKAAAQELKESLHAWGELRKMTDGAIDDLILSNELRPEAIGSLLLRAGSGTIKQAKKALPEDVYKAALREGLEDLWNQSTKGESVADTAQLVTAGAQRGAGRAQGVVETFDPVKFQAKLESIGEANVRILFGAEGQHQLNQLAQFVKARTRPGGLADISEELRAPQLLAAGVDGTLAVGFLFGQRLQSAAAASAINVISRIWFRPNARRSFMAAIKMVGNRNMRGATWFLNRVGEQLQEEKPEIPDRDRQR